MRKEGDNFWNRGTRFYNTVFQRSSSLPIRNREDANPCSEGNDGEQFNRPKKSASTLTLAPTINKEADTDNGDSFKEARAHVKLERNKTMAPLPHRKDSDKGIMWKLIHNEFRKSSKPSTNPKETPYSSLFKHFASVKLDGSDGVKDKWTKYYEREGGGMVTAFEADDEHKVDLSQLFLGLRFAHGAYSKLYHGVYKDKAVAVKMLTIPDEDDENKTLKARLKKQFISEVNLLCTLQHANVIRFVAACSKPPVYCIITEYLAEGSLRSYLRKKEKRLPLTEVVAYGLEIARAMEYIHSQDVIHRDLKPENILISDDLHMKVADFGVACDASDCDPYDDDTGTYRWMAPEMIKKKCYGRKVDVYSFGIVLWELVSGSLPYEDMNPIQAAYAVVNKKLRPPMPEDCPSVMGALIEQCWHSQPEKRPEFSQIVKVLEKFEASIVANGNLELVQSINFQDHKKGFVHWIHKHSPPSSKSMMKPRFI